MKSSQYFLKDADQRLTIELTRVGLFVIILCVGIFSYLYEKNFTNWEVLSALFFVLIMAFSSHLLIATFNEYLSQTPILFFFTFIFDALLTSSLVYFSDINQSLFLFFFLVNILLVGLVFQSFGGFLLAAITSMAYTTMNLASPEMKTLNQILILLLNNISFYAVAGLSGFLNHQFELTNEELKITGLNLKSAEHLNKEVIENMPAGLITFDENGDIVQYNSYSEKIIGKKLSEEKSIFKALPGVGPILNEIKQLNISDRTPFDFKLADQNGDVLILVLTVSKIINSVLQKELYILLIEDLTKIRNLEYSLRQSEKMAAVGGLAAGIAHEFRNPLASISGSIEMMSQTIESEDDKKLMKIVLREIDRLNRLIGEFLEYSRPEKPPEDLVNLGDLCNEVLESIKMNKSLPQEIIQEKNLEKDFFILGRRDKLKQALINIFTNSYQAISERKMTEGQGFQGILKVSLERRNNEIRLEVKDNGCGMSESTKSKMFEPFHTTKIKGTGLGLAITYKILESHAAKFEVDSEVGVGTSIVMIFPSKK